jgi:HK97 family phage prohead protease
MDNLQHKKGNRPIYYKAMADVVSIDAEMPRKVSGYLAAFGNRDMHGDILLKGCFAKSLAEHGPGAASPRKIAYLYQHEMDEPIGRFTNLTEDDKGLYFEAEIDEIDTGDDVLIQYASGTLNQHSIGFRYIWDKMEYDQATDSYIVKEVELFEGSVVTIGANENTPFQGFKDSQIETMQTKLSRDTERILKALPIDSQIKLRSLISKHIALAEQPGRPLIESKPPTPEDRQELNYDKLIKSFTII